MEKELNKKEVLIAGYSVSNMNHISQLTLGLKDEAGVSYFGIADKGLNREDLQDKLLSLLEPLKVERSPLRDAVDSDLWITWVKPVLVCEVKPGATDENSIAHAEFLWLREDGNLGY